MNKNDLKALYSLLEQQVEDALRISLSGIVDDPNDPASSEDIRNKIRLGHRLSMQITTDDNSTVSQDNISIFEKPDFPDKIKNVYISTHHRFASLFPNFLPRNYLEIFLDFSRSSIALNFINLPSNPTPNESNFYLNGLDEGWIDSTFNKLEKFFNDRQNNRAFIHKSGVYDFFLYFFFAPLALGWMLKIEKISLPYIQEVKSNFATIFIYGYIIIGFSVLARIIYQYIRWLFPTAEYVSDKKFGPILHRTVLGTILAAFAYPVLIKIFEPIFAF